ncbi:patatin-like phospholipase family protein [Glaciibacter psychrotolerans]|uniref:NTE family protein n=1 Tax=Glaciibacter psychrotolerans TaxID=670054 RepID=A0A7Z0EER9_9MICO|nr:patatin-like phospholipase family protein [Leifsonia psychrotolerans]NYJ20161.1 NTE family protein [Leifsonia psychrotolerans]
MPDADLVLEGGGVKGSALVGAITEMVTRADPYRFHRVAGTSAGAIVASFLAAGLSPAAIKQIMDDLDFTQFEDEPKVFAHLPHIGATFGLLFKEGMFVGDFMHRWIADTLAANGVRTWADLKEDDPGSALPPDQRYKLVVIVSDVSRGLMLRLPWDYRSLLGVDPDSQLVADAVRASASIPFFFQPFRMQTDVAAVGHTEIVCTDGGMLSNYPIDIFDRRDDEKSRWPTLGIKLSARTSVTQTPWSPDADSIQLARSLLSTMLSAHDRVHVDDPAFASRTIFIDTTGFGVTDFHLTAEDKSTLFRRGVTGADKFLATWNWELWKKGDFTQLLSGAPVSPPTLPIR